MELSYNDLRKRDVINISDGRCLGRIIDLRLCFPEGVLIGIVVPGRKTRGFFRLFDKSELYIDESRIIKIGGDVILVDINCGDLCSSGVRINKGNSGKNNKHPHSNCNPKPCPPPHPHYNNQSGGCGSQPDFSILSGGDDRIDKEDY
ncbi:MAG: YlmC/YmxH family sporulation protein [Clostridia bacterium]|nr:YlmC/YmxH family sporulation protein [Clostridia bacterium]